MPNDPRSALRRDTGPRGGRQGRLVGCAESLCRLVARRDLAHVPLYIVPQSQLPSVCGTAKHCHAYTTPSLDLYFRDHMRSWRGRGPCMLINDRGVYEDTDPTRPVFDSLVTLSRRAGDPAARGISDPR